MLAGVFGRQERAQEFVDDLVKYAANPSLLPDVRKLTARASSSTGEDDALDDDLDVIVAAVERTRLADINDLMGNELELKATAPTFVPGTMVRMFVGLEVQELHCVV